MSPVQRLALVDREDPALSVAAQCRLLKVARSTLYYQPAPVDPDDLALMHWFSRRVLAWRLSITMEADFCVDALQDALARYGKPEIFNTDQGVQFTSAGFLEVLESRGIRISMDGKGRFLDNIFIERLW